MTLLIDLGNTRIKWARERNGRATAQRSMPSVTIDRSTFAPLFARLVADEPVRAVNVAGEAAEAALRTAARAAGLPAPLFLRSTSRTHSAGGVLVNAYREPWRLGADRWAALIGARALTHGKSPLCVVDIGTAMTVDFVSADGRHRGGYIVPGPRLAVDSLLAGTDGIRQRAAGGRRTTDRPWPRSTLPAIERGALEAAAGMVDRCTAEARGQFGKGTRLLLTGGGAPAVLPLLDAKPAHHPDLVLQGLQAWDAADC
ncbi:MAG: type III pantothenate kinase [Steroidobacteraceae bacterium]